MKVLMFGWEFPPFNSGGLGTATEGLTKALSSKNVELIFVIPKNLPLDVPYMKIVTPEVYGIKETIYFNSFLKPYITSSSQFTTKDGMVFWADGLIEEVLRYADFAKMIAKKEKFDVIHAHDWLSFPAGTAAAEVSGKPLVLHVHATEYDRSVDEKVNPAIYAIEKETMERADAIIAVSAFTRKIITAKYGIKPEKISVVSNGVNVKEFSDNINGAAFIEGLKKKGFKVVLFLGRITAQKGPDYFLQVAQKTLQYNDKILFLVAGDGDMMNYMVNKTSEMGITDNILFTGFVRGEEKKRMFRTADLFVMPSISEPFGIVALEALASNTPILVSKQSGVSEVIHHALKADFWDIDEMVNKILTFLKSKPLQNDLQKNGKQEVKDFTWDEAANKSIGVYNKVVNDK